MIATVSIQSMATLLNSIQSIIYSLYTGNDQVLNALTQSIIEETINTTDPSMALDNHIRYDEFILMKELAGSGLTAFIPDDERQRTFEFKIVGLHHVALSAAIEMLVHECYAENTTSNDSLSYLAESIVQATLRSCLHLRHRADCVEFYDFTAVQASLTAQVRSLVMALYPWRPKGPPNNMQSLAQAVFGASLHLSSVDHQAQALVQTIFTAIVGLRDRSLDPILGIFTSWDQLKALTPSILQLWTSVRGLIATLYSSTGEATDAATNLVIQQLLCDLLVGMVPHEIHPTGQKAPRALHPYPPHRSIGSSPDQRAVPYSHAHDSPLCGLYGDSWYGNTGLVRSTGLIRLLDEPI